MAPGGCCRPPGLAAHPTDASAPNQPPLPAQMHKDVALERPPWRSIILKHEHLRQRLYYLPGAGERAPAEGCKELGGGLWVGAL